MLIQPAHSSSAIASSEPFFIHPMWCASNPNVDRSAPPPAKKKTAKKKLATKKTVKRR
jgi:hypothetical protein